MRFRICFCLDPCSMMTCVECCLVLLILVRESGSQGNQSDPADELDTTNRELYPGVGFPAMFPIWKGAKVRECNNARYTELKINEWWDHYFTNATPADPKEYEELYTFFNLAQSDYQTYEKALDNDLCLAYLTLNECSGEKCQCRSSVGAYMYNYLENTGPVPFDSAQKQYEMVCLIKRGQHCAKKTAAYDYKTYKVTRRRCEPTFCCKFQWDSGESLCEDCKAASGTALHPTTQAHAMAFSTGIFLVLFHVVIPLPRTG